MWHGMRDLCAPTSHHGCVLRDTEPGRAELQEWPAPQGTSSPSGPGRESSKNCPWGLKLSSLVDSASFLWLPCICTLLLPPSLCCLSNSQAKVATQPRKHANNGWHQPQWPSPQPITHQCFGCFTCEWKGMPTWLASGLLSKVRIMGSEDFKVKMFTKKLLALEFFWPWGGFLSFGHCLVKRAIE
jgi:hypothetical protein